MPRVLHRIFPLAWPVLIALIGGNHLDCGAADQVSKTRTLDASQSENPPNPVSRRDGPGIVRWTGSGESNRWLDPGNWDPGVPGHDDMALFENTNSEKPIVVDELVELGHLRVQLPHRLDRLTLAGEGTLTLNGRETEIPNKYSAALIVTGILDIGPEVTVDIRHQRFTAGNKDGTIVIRSDKVRAGKKALTSKSYHSDGDDLKFGVTDRGRVVLAAPHWEPGMSLDLSASHTEGPKVFELAQERGTQGMTFTCLKEHDGDPIEIRGFNDGDFIRFRADPFLSCDQGKELHIEAVQFVGWSEGGAATIEEHAGFWYLKPKGSRR